MATRPSNRRRPTEKADKPERGSMRIGQEYGATGLAATSGYVMEDFEKSLQGSNGLKRFREMAFSHPVIAAAVFGYRQMLTAPKVWVEPASEKAADVEAAELVEQSMGDMRHEFASFRNEVVSYLIYGFSYHEIVYKRRLGRQPFMYTQDPITKAWVQTGKPSSKYDDGRIGWYKFAPRNAETIVRWEIVNGDLVGAYQSGPPDYVEHWQPFEKCLHFTTNTMWDNPEGISILRPTYRQYRLSMRIEDAEAIGVARNLHGYPVLTAPEGVDLFDGSDEVMKALLDDCKKLVTNIKRDEQMGAVLPFGWMLELLNAGGQNIDTNAILDRYHARIAMAMLVQFLLLGMERGGAYELAKQQQGLWLRAVRGYLDSDLAVMNTFAIPRLLDLNDFTGLTDYPKLVAEDITEPEIMAIADYTQKLAGQGFMMPSPETETHLRERAGFPELEEDFSMLPPAAQEPAQSVEPGHEPKGEDVGSGQTSTQKFSPSNHHSIHDVLAKEHEHPNVRDVIEDEFDHGPEEER